jgi:hypothetical protein
MEQRLSDAQIESRIIEAIGVKLAGILKDNTPSRICGLLTAKRAKRGMGACAGAHQRSLHPMPGKPSHSMFCKKLRDPAVLKEYIKKAASAAESPDRVASCGGQPALHGL